MIPLRISPKLPTRVGRFLSIEAAPRSERGFRAMPIAELEALYVKAKKAYYDLKKPRPIMSDELFDTLEDVLKERKPKSKYLQMVGAPVSGAKVKLPFPMSSLAKMKVEDADAWLAKRRGPYVLEDKEDGISLQAVGTKTGTKLYSRGRSNKGDASESWGKDMSHLVPHLKLGKLKAGQAVRCEIAITPEKFKRWAKEFENERQIIGALATRQSVHPSVKDVDVIVYGQLAPMEKPSVYLPKLKAQGWNVVPYKIVKSVDAATLSRYYAERKKKSKWKIDGIVVVQDIAAEPSTADPAHARAFKENDESQAQQATVVKIEWNATRYGVMAPKVLIKPVRLAGVTVKQATGWNAKKLIQMGIGPGAVIRIVRSGETIPHILGVIKKAKPNMPEVKTEWDEHGTHLRMKGTSDVQEAKRLVHFFKTINVDGLKIGTATKLHEAGLDTPLKVCRATEPKLARAIGSQVIAKKIYASIRAQLASIDHVRLMDASAIFGAGIGSRRAASILKGIPYLKLSKMTPRRMAAAIAGLPGFTLKTAEPFAVAFPKYIAFVEALGVKVALPKTIKATGTKMRGQKVCFTGFRDKALEEAIIKNGGEIASSVTRDTTLVVYTEQRGKYDRAVALGITTMTPEQFKRKYKL